MNKYKIYLKFLGIILLLGNFSCNQVLDMKPLNEISDADYWNTPDQYKLATNEFYTYLRSFSDILDDNPHSDRRTDFLYTRDGANLFSNGSNTIPISDGTWNTSYTRLRAINYLLAKASTYAKPADIKVYVAETKFFKAYIYFDLLQCFGGVPIVNSALTTSSAELQAPRNTRDEVTDLIITNLEDAIADLPVESLIAATDKGRVSKGAVQGFLSRVALYEGTWQKYRGNATRAATLLDKAITNSAAVISSGEYQLFAPVALGDSAQKYLFNLENQQSNPANITKTVNKEYILANRYDQAIRQIRVNVSKQVINNIQWPTKKFVDNYLCKDGLPIEKSPLFKGYSTTTSEFQNRDNRMRYNLLVDGQYHWTNQNQASRVSWKSDAADIANSNGKYNSAQNSGYANQKWGAERKVLDLEEGQDFPVIRYAEILLNFAEATFEKNNTISDADLDKSLNLVRTRVNKTMPKLSTGFVSANALDMLAEIRRERNIELYFEGFRRDDVIRWKIAETELPKDIQGITWTGTQYQTRWAGISGQVFGGVLRLETGRKWADKNYLLPIPSQQIQLNPNLTQNPGW
ncbi:MAG: RagB/SusD family nutrient uptake outer membrane protein [Bacteroidota bacterium]